MCIYSRFFRKCRRNRTGLVKAYFVVLVDAWIDQSTVLEQQSFLVPTKFFLTKKQKLVYLQPRHP